MNYVIFDLEFNQAWDFKENVSQINPKCPFEIIQIGALKLDESFQLISTFDSLVKPELYTSVHPFVKQLTGITEENLATAKTFKEIYKEFSHFISNESILCVWGTMDIKELLRNTRFHKLDISIIPKTYINVQLYASKYLHYPKGINVGLRNAVELLNIPIRSSFHDAFNDSCYTTEIFKRIYNHDIKPALYNLSAEARRKRFNKKAKVDLDKLIKQFEKMYNRQMSEEEQSIIKLAYMMGRTSQFLAE
jgi:inhibitor of KinA sporulation pathway (predicted exonuclease)